MPKFRVGDIVERIKSPHIGERAVVVKVSGDANIYIEFDNKQLIKGRVYNASPGFIRLVDPYDDLLID